MGLVIQTMKYQSFRHRRSIFSRPLTVFFQLIQGDEAAITASNWQIKLRIKSVPISAPSIMSISTVHLTAVVGGDRANSIAELHCRSNKMWSFLRFPREENLRQKCQVRNPIKRLESFRHHNKCSQSRPRINKPKQIFSG